MRTPILTAGLLALLAAPALADETTYTLKIKDHPDAGKSVAVKVREAETRRTKILDSTGAVSGDEKKEEVLEEDYTDTVLEKGDKGPKKFKRTYTRAVEGEKGKPEARSHDGKTVVFENKDGKYRLTVEGKDRLNKEDEK